jgi:L-rhamnose mutarotase
MKLKPGYQAEYKKRHDDIWPELKEELKDAGISNYSICLHEESGTLFAYQQLSDSNSADDLPNKDIVKKWWAFMADIMDTNPDNSPKVTELTEVFYLN